MGGLNPEWGPQPCGARLTHPLRPTFMSLFLHLSCCYPKSRDNFLGVVYFLVEPVALFLAHCLVPLVPHPPHVEPRALFPVVCLDDVGHRVRWMGESLGD